MLYRNCRSGFSLKQNDTPFKNEFLVLQRSEVEAVDGYETVSIDNNILFL